MKPYRLSTLLELVDETLKAAKVQCERRQGKATGSNLGL